MIPPFDDRFDVELSASENTIILYVDYWGVFNIDRNVFLKSYFNKPSKYFQKLLRKIYE
jgi:hypothetical protein